MEFKPDSIESFSNNELVRSIIPMMKSSLLPEISPSIHRKSQFPNGYAN